jgi:hypothetical protein
MVSAQYEQCWETLKTAKLLNPVWFSIFRQGEIPRSPRCSVWIAIAVKQPQIFCQIKTNRISFHWLRRVLKFWQLPQWACNEKTDTEIV